MNRVFVICNGESRQRMNLEDLRQYGKIYGCNALYRDFTPDALVAVDDRIVHKIYWSGYPLKNQCYFRDWNPMPAEAYEMILLPEMIADDIDEVTPDMIFSNKRGDSKEFVVHGTHKDRMKDAEVAVREMDEKGAQILTEEVYDILFEGWGFHVSWLAEEDMVQSTTAPGFIPGGDFGLGAGSLAHLISAWVEKPDEIYFIGMDLYSTDNKFNNVYKGTESYMGAGGNAVPPHEWILQHKTIMHRFPEIRHYKVNEKSLEDPRIDPINRVISEWNDTPNLEYLTHAELFGKLVASSVT